MEERTEKAPRLLPPSQRHVCQQHSVEPTSALTCTNIQPTLRQKLPETMATAGDLIDFNVIEAHKENIQALPSGRSAKALAQLYSPALGAQPSPALTQDAHSKDRAVFEKELESSDEADDPLEVYDRYVKWTLDAYPSAQATPQSQLRPLLERATQTFQKTAHYKNDPRYLKIWLHYIRLFSDAPREAFAFLARHGIGEGLALYYEEFAAWLENSGRWTQAEEVYKIGIEKDARPVERLLRKFSEFERRLEVKPQDIAEPTSPALPSARPALAAKLDPFASSSPTTNQELQSRSIPPKKSKSSKMAIFSDADEQPRPDSGSSTKGWDSIGSIAERKKENMVKAEPWAGMKLKGGKTNGGMPKLMVFKDGSRSLPKHIQRTLSNNNGGSQCVLNPKTGRMECVFVNLEAVYPESGRRPKEYCLEELRARGVSQSERPWDTPIFRNRRKVDESSPNLSLDPPQVLEPHVAEIQQQVVDLSISDAAPTTTKKQRSFAIFEDMPPSRSPELSRAKPKQRGFVIFEDEPAQATPPPVESDEKVATETAVQTIALNDENDENAPPQTQKAIEKQLRREQRREERANRTRKIQVMDVKHIKNETKTIQLNLDSPTGPKIRRKKSSDRNAEPTMTINTKEAMDEIYGIFNQPLPSQAQESEAEEEESDDDYTTGDESTGTGKLSGPPSEYGDDTRNELLVSQKSADAGEDGRTEETGWSDFTTSKHVPKEASESTQHTTQSTSWDIYQDDKENGDLIDPTTPDEPLADNPETRYVPLPPEDYEPPRGQYRDMAVMANNRLPFMTPIVEQTETSLGASTVRIANKDYFHVKTPSRKNGSIGSLAEDSGPDSSPFQDVTAEIDVDKRKVLQPIRTKSTKGTISLGQGSAKSQIAAQTTELIIAEPVQKGPIIKELQCNPMDPQIRETILSQMKPSLSSFDGYFEHLDQSSNRTSEIRKYIKNIVKSGKSSTGLDKTASTLSLPPMLSLEGAQDKYAVRKQLGAGTFAPVYLVENHAIMTREDEDSTGEEQRIGKTAYRKALEAIKMEDPPSSWEFYILQLSHRRLGVSRAAESIVRAHEMHLFRDECFLVEEYRDQGTLLDLVNLARLDSGNGGGMDEVMAMWLTVELLRTTEALHTKNLIHGDLKGDNVLVRFDDPGSETDWSPTYFANGAHGWAAKGICLIDFGRGIDTKHFDAHVGFIADWKTSEADCAEMRELRPWTFQIDYHGLAGIIHSMLFGRYMETIGEKGGAIGQGATKSYRIREALKRYWQTEIWSEVFDLLLNPLAHLEAEEGHRMPVLRSMKTCRERMESWLEENCERGVGLKGMIAKMESAIRERRRRVIKA